MAGHLGISKLSMACESGQCMICPDTENIAAFGMIVECTCDHHDSVREVLANRRMASMLALTEGEVEPPEKK